MANLTTYIMCVSTSVVLYRVWYCTECGAVPSVDKSTTYLMCGTPRVCLRDNVGTLWFVVRYHDTIHTQSEAPEYVEETLIGGY